MGVETGVDFRGRRFTEASRQAWRRAAMPTEKGFDDHGPNREMQRL
jgi:hypothetical protein